MKIAIIGAGMAGLSCADGLTEDGHEVFLFDKGRGPGGRMSTRRAATPIGEASFDHGAQYFEAHDQDFKKIVTAWAAQGLAAPWPDAAAGTWVGVPSMSAIVKQMASGHNVEFDFLVRTIRRTEHDWQIVGEPGIRRGFDVIVVALPAEQAASIISLHDLSMAQSAVSTRTRPCWTAMFAFADTVPYDAPVIEKVGPIARAVRNNAKPGRGAIECWVVQADESWSSSHMEDGSDLIAEELRAKLGDAVDGQLPQVIYQTAHRWRYALPPGTGLGTLWNKDLRLGACGDWLLGPHVECAWHSGKALAFQIGETAAW